MSDKGMQVHHIHSPIGQAIIVTAKLTTPLLLKAIDRFQEEEKMKIGTFIGVQEQGFVYIDEPNWTPDVPDAFKKTFGFIPWIQIHELLKHIPPVSTEEFLNSI